MRVPAPSLAVLVFAASAHAQSPPPEICAKVSEDKARLECYDLAYRKTLNVSTTSKWKVREETSKVDDSRTVFLIVDSVEEMRGRYGKSEVAQLVMACREKDTDIYIGFGTHFMTSLNGAGKITTRVDKQPARSHSWRELNDNNALGLWTTASAVPFIKTLIGGASFTRGERSPIINRLSRLNSPYRAR